MWFCYHLLFPQTLSPLPKSTAGVRVFFHAYAILYKTKGNIIFARPLSLVGEVATVSFVSVLNYRDCITLLQKRCSFMKEKRCHILQAASQRWCQTHTLYRVGVLREGTMSYAQGLSVGYDQQKLHEF